MDRNALVAVEQALTGIQPRLEALLPAAGLPVQQLVQTIVFACEQTPRLLECERPSLLRSAMTAATLGLICDGVSGQGYILPFRAGGKLRAQFITGYKGYVTLAGRAQRTLEGFVVREGDGFEFDEASGRVVHQRQLGNEKARQITAAYAVSRCTHEPTKLRVMSIDQVLEVRDSSSGWKAFKAGRAGSSPWQDNFATMVRKTPMNNLAKDIPVVSLQLAVAIEGVHDRGGYAYADERGQVVTEDPPLEASATVETTSTPGPVEYAIVSKKGGRKVVGDLNAWLMYWSTIVKEHSAENVAELLRANQAEIEMVAMKHPNEMGVKALVDRMAGAL